MPRSVVALGLTALLAACGSAAERVAPEDGGLSDGARALVPGEPRGGSPGVPRRGPPYPVVLAHGFLGFDRFAEVDALAYFYGVVPELARRGESNVFVTEVDPFNSSAFRGAQLLASIESILKETGFEKANVVAHSQGGLDARVVAHDRPDLVASVVTIATPHAGMRVADLVFGVDPGSVGATVLDAATKAFGGPLFDAIGNETSLAKALKQFTRANLIEFNERYTNSSAVRYYSFAGRSGLAGSGGVCSAAQAPPWLARWDSERDPVRGALLGTWIVSGGARDPSDGLVSVESSKWGTFLGCVPADHFDEVGQIFGESPGLGNRFSHLEFYADLVRDLRALGL